MAICNACDKVYADKFEDCPHCSGGSRKVLSLAVLGAIGLAASFGLWALVGKSPEHSDRSLSSNEPAQTEISPRAASDPYASGQQALSSTDYERSKQDLIGRAKMAASAARCRVISDVESQVIDRAGINAISDADIGAGRSDYHPDLLPAIRAAALKAYQDAAVPGACSFWEQHPEAVSQIRQLAYLATTGP